MNATLLIDAIVRETTVLIAQLSTAAGLRAPLANIAEQVFLQLSREIESQGVPRKAVADMFGLALRGYQRKVQRLTESTTAVGGTLWSAVIEFIQQHGEVSRRALLARFRQEDPTSLGAVQSAAALLWATVFRHPGLTTGELAELVGHDPDGVEREVAALIDQSRIQLREGRLHAELLVVPVGAHEGWEAALFDHYHAVVRALSTKLRMRKAESRHADVVGGATLTFDLHRSHPRRAEVLGLLADVRGRLNALWEEVEAHNREQPIAEGEAEQVCFYFGQSYSGEEEA